MWFSLFSVSGFLGWFSFFGSSLSEMNLSVNSAAKDNIITLAKSSSLLFLHLWVGGGVNSGWI